MKKVVKRLLFVVAIFMAALILASITLYMFLPINLIKDFASKKLSEELHRSVKIKGASFNLFSGIKLNGISISNGKNFSKEPMILADSIELKYAFWPLFQKKVLIPEITLIKPEILIEKNKNGVFNFSDMFGASAKKQPSKAVKSADKDFSISLLINSFKISKGKIIYYDHYTGKSGLKDLNLKISNITLVALKPIAIELSAIGSYLDKDIPIALSGKIGFDIKTMDSAKVEDVKLSVGGETLFASANIKGLKKAPNVSVSLSSQKFTIDNLLAIFIAGGATTQKEKIPHGALTASLKKSFASIPSNLSLLANINFRNITFKTIAIDSLVFDSSLSNKTIYLKIKDLSAYKGTLTVEKLKLNLPQLAYSIQNLSLKNFSAEPFLNDAIDSFFPNLLDLRNNVEGTLDVSLSTLKGQGVEMPEAFNNLSSRGIILLSKGRIKKIKSLESIGKKYNINMLKNDLIVGGLRIEAVLGNKVLNVTKLSLQETDLRVGFNGGLDFNNMKYASGNRLYLTFSPDATKGLPQELAIFKDGNGFVELVFELQGSLLMPLPVPILDKVIKAEIGKLKVEIEAKKVEIESKVKEETQKAKTQLEEEAKKKVKEIFKF